jgi:hypothetical protein
VDRKIDFVDACVQWVKNPKKLRIEQVATVAQLPTEKFRLLSVALRSKHGFPLVRIF